MGKTRQIITSSGTYRGLGTFVSGNTVTFSVAVPEGKETIMFTEIQSPFIREIMKLKYMWRTLQEIAQG